ncbi:MAG TPA: sensor histidine kinase [Nitrospiria bacterium]
MVFHKLSSKVTLLVAAATLSVLSLGFILVARLMEHHAASPIRYFELWLVLSAAGTTAALSALLVFLVRRIITRRILDLGRLAHRISQGDLRARVRTDTNDEIGQLGRILNLMADRLEKARANLEKELEAQKELDHLKDNFLAMVGHELRTPLTAVVGLSSAMSEGYAGDLNQEQIWILQQIQEKGEHLHGIINNILDIEKMQNGQMKMLMEECRLQDLLEGSFSMIEIRAKKKRLDLRNVFDIDLTPIVMDRIKVQSVITNLLDNAIKFTPSGGKIEVSGRLRNDTLNTGFVEVLVSDTGIGIPAQEREKVFERFHQGQEGLTRNFSGVGLGLPLARAFAQSHGGWLEIVERPEWATTFSFGLPLTSPGFYPVIDIRKSRCNLPSMINGIIQMLEEEEGRRLDIDAVWPLDEEIEEIEADREYVRSILIIIFQNSLRHRDPGAPIRITGSSESGVLRILIENDGPPFPEEELKRLFAPGGGRNSGSTAPSPSFSLRTAMTILQTHGGSLEIENTAGSPGETKGSGVRYTLRLPYRPRVATNQGGLGHVQEKSSDY